jgi:hypothetical protein
MTNCVGSGEWYLTAQTARTARTVPYHFPLPAVLGFAS